MACSNDKSISFKLIKSKNLKKELIFWLIIIFVFVLIYLMLNNRVSEYKLERDEILTTMNYCNVIYNNGIIYENISSIEVEECIKKIK